MEDFFFPNSGTYSRRPFFPDNEVYSRRPFLSDSGPFFPDGSTYTHHPFFPDTGASFFPDTGVYPRRPFADDKHRSGSRHDTSVPVHYANNKHHANDKHMTGFADHKHRSTDDNSVPVHYANDKHRTGFADHKHRSTDDNSVPIHYAGKHQSDYADHKYRSTKSDRSAAVIKIQKIVRGFLVRKDMRTVRKITAEMAEIGHQISALKFCDNDKQRLWIGEMLMALLLRLDAVRGVREYRRKVVRRVIQFQEAVDSIAQGRSVETADSAEIYTGAIEENTTIEEAVEDGDEIACREINRETFGLSIEDSMGKSPQMAMAIKESMARAAAENEALKRMARAAAENEALKRMVEELCERSQQQCDLLSSLVLRVEHLESRVQDMEQREKDKKIH